MENSKIMDPTTRDVTDSESESDGIRQFAQIRNPTDTSNPIVSDSKFLQHDVLA